MPGGRSFEEEVVCKVGQSYIPLVKRFNYSFLQMEYSK